MTRCERNFGKLKVIELCQAKMQVATVFDSVLVVLDFKVDIKLTRKVTFGTSCFLKPRIASRIYRVIVVFGRGVRVLTVGPVRVCV